MSYDVIVLGGGPGGYSAAEKCGAAGLKTVCIEGIHLGGTCLNEGCIPTKSLLNSGKLYLHTKEGEVYGVTAKDIKIDHNSVIDHKNEVVNMLVGGVGATLKANNVEVISEMGIIKERTANGITVTAGDKDYTGTNLIIATGSVVSILPIPGVEEGLKSGFVVTNKELLDMRELPKELVVLGGGVIGLEMATYFGMIGVKTTVIEMLDHIGGPADRDLTKVLQKDLEKLGMTFILNAKVTKITNNGVLYEKDGKSCKVKADKVLLSIGRKPNTATIGLENLGIEMDHAAIVTDEHMKTNIPNVYAIGDVNAKIMLAHTAYREADVAVNTILGKKDCMHYSAIPNVIYTSPELSSVGETEASAKEKGIDFKCIKLPMLYSGRYVAENKGGKGICKLIFERSTKTLIGAQFLCNYSSEFIALAGAYIEMKLTVDEMKEIVIPHPTVAEIIREALVKY